MSQGEERYHQERARIERGHVKYREKLRAEGKLFVRDRLKLLLDPGTELLLEMQRRVDDVYVDPALIEYAVRLTEATRQPELVGLGDLARYVSFGASPRASARLCM